MISKENAVLTTRVGIMVHTRRSPKAQWLVKFVLVLTNLAAFGGTLLKWRTAVLITCMSYTRTLQTIFVTVVMPVPVSRLFAFVGYFGRDTIMSNFWFSKEARVRYVPQVNWLVSAFSITVSGPVFYPKSLGIKLNQRRQRRQRQLWYLYTFQFDN